MSWTGSIDEHLIALAREEADRFGLTLEQLQGPSRKPELVAARRAVAFAAREDGYSLPEIGRVLNRDHSTVLYALRAPAPNTAPTRRRRGRVAAIGL